MKTYSLDKTNLLANILDSDHIEITDSNEGPKLTF